MMRDDTQRSVFPKRAMLTIFATRDCSALFLWVPCPDLASLCLGLSLHSPSFPSPLPPTTTTVSLLTSHLRFWLYLNPAQTSQGRSTKRHAFAARSPSSTPSFPPPPLPPLSLSPSTLILRLLSRPHFLSSLLWLNPLGPPHCCQPHQQLSALLAPFIFFF
jgi:hypothetical protein